MLEDGGGGYGRRIRDEGDKNECREGTIGKQAGSAKRLQLSTATQISSGATVAQGFSKKNKEVGGRRMEMQVNSSHSTEQQL